MNRPAIRRASRGVSIPELCLEQQTLHVQAVHYSIIIRYLGRVTYTRGLEATRSVSAARTRLGTARTAPRADPLEEVHGPQVA